MSHIPICPSARRATQQWSPVGQGLEGSPAGGDGGETLHQLGCRDSYEMTT